MFGCCWQIGVTQSGREVGQGGGSGEQFGEGINGRELNSD